MGKDSLIKSTTKKKAKTKKEEETKKKTTKKAAAKPKKASQSKAKPKVAAKSASKKTTKKVKSAPAKSKAKKASTAAKPKAASKTRVAATKKAKPVTIKQLLAKRFDPLPGAPKTKGLVERQTAFSDSPPIISSSDPKEVARMRALLSAQYRMEEIKSAAKPPEVKESVAPSAAPEMPATETKAAQADAPEAAPAGGAADGLPPIEDKPVITTTLPPENAQEPLSPTVKYSIVGALILILLLLGISQNNSAKYYIQPKEGALEIWKGRFSPKDKRFFMVLHGVELEQQPKAIYSRSDVFPMIFNYYLDKADTLLDVSGLPDFEGIKSYLYQAQTYVVTEDMKNKVKSRLNSIERMILLYKADVSISKGTKETLKSALKDLKKASGMVANPTQKQEIDQKIELVKKLQADLKSVDK